MGVVIPFRRAQAVVTPTTHFVSVGTIALCGEEIQGFIGKQMVPDCEACVEAWSKATGWTFPLPAIGYASAGG